MADPHYYAGGQAASAPQIQQQYAPPPQLQQQQSYEQQAQPQETFSNYQPNGQQQDYPQNQAGNWFDDRPTVPVEQQIHQQYPEGSQFVSNPQFQQDLQYAPPPLAQGPPNQQVVIAELHQPPPQGQPQQPLAYQPPPQDQQLAYQPPSQGQPLAYQPPSQGQPLAYQPQEPPQQYQQDSRGQYRPAPQDTQYQVNGPDHQGYYNDRPREFSPVRDAQPAPRHESHPQELDVDYGPPPPPQDHMRYEPYPEPESDIRYEGHSSRYDHELAESRYSRHPSQRGYRNSFPEPEIDRSYVRAVDRFPPNEHRSRYDNSMDIPTNGLYRGERHRPANAREGFRSRPQRNAYTSPDKNRLRDEFSNVPRFEAYRSAEPPARHKYASPERDRFRFDEMAKALPRVKVNKQVGLRRFGSSNDRDFAPGYGNKRSPKRIEYLKEPRRRELSPPLPPPKPRYSQRQSMREPLSPREDFQRSRGSRDRYW